MELMYMNVFLIVIYKLIMLCKKYIIIYVYYGDKLFMHSFVVFISRIAKITPMSTKAVHHSIDYTLYTFCIYCWVQELYNDRILSICHWDI